MSGQPNQPQKPSTPPTGATRPAPNAPKPAAPGAKPAQPAARGAVPPAKPGAVPGKPGTPAGKTPPKPVATGKGPAKPPPPAKKTGLASSGGRKKLGQILIDLGLLEEDQLWEVLNEARDNAQLLGQAALSRGLVTEEQLYQALAEQFGMKLINLSETKFQQEAIEKVPETMATVYKVVPISLKDGVLTVALGDPNQLPALDDLRNFIGVKEVQAMLSSPKALAEAQIRCYAGKQESIVDIIKELEASPELGRLTKESSIDLEALTELQDAAPVRKLLNMVMLLGIKDRASDIHFEPFEDEYKMRYRCDGVLYEMVPPPRHLSMAISSRIKVMSNLDIAERRLPQDGRIELNVGGNQVDMRVSVLPTMFGESVVIRVLDRTVVQLDLDKIGMEEDMLAEFRKLIKKPNGIILITGPTGAGKTTTLYSALNELNDITEKIITTEDPVEYDIDGIVQIPINSEIDVTFANALRAILRHDPDKILVGEIRDLETAQIAVQASLTGHIVFSTLHTNDAASSVTRLRDMGLEPYLITATVEGIMAQRLVRKICIDCRTEYEPSPEQLMELGLHPNDAKGISFFYGRGCDRCNNTGYRGRSGIYEFLPINDEIRDLIMANASSEEITVCGKKYGMSTLREAGLRALNRGLTTIDEVARETVTDDS
ncbi:MAG: Flp pilus assembly complex ATPase component TadA [Planctomycetia bacterium]|nr:Flp pilus assembly complex ATPase component TadA [Planctomycetia bacterium]